MWKYQQSSTYQVSTASANVKSVNYKHDKDGKAYASSTSQQPLHYLISPHRRVTASPTRQEQTGAALIATKPSTIEHIGPTESSQPRRNLSPTSAALNKMILVQTTARRTYDRRSSSDCRQAEATSSPRIGQATESARTAKRKRSPSEELCIPDGDQSQYTKRVSTPLRGIQANHGDSTTSRIRVNYREESRQVATSTSRHQSNNTMPLLTSGATRSPAPARSDASAAVPTRSVEPPKRRRGRPPKQRSMVESGAAEPGRMPTSESRRRRNSSDSLSELDYRDAAHRQVQAELRDLKRQAEVDAASGDKSARQPEANSHRKSHRIRRIAVSETDTDGEIPIAQLLSSPRRSQNRAASVTPKLESPSDDDNATGDLLPQSGNPAVGPSRELGASVPQPTLTRSMSTVSSAASTAVRGSRRSRSAHTTPPSNSTCHLCASDCEQDLLRCCACSSRLCRACLVSKYSHQAAYAAIVLLSKLAQNQAAATDAQAQTDSADRDNHVLQGLRAILSLCALSVDTLQTHLSQLDFQCPTCKSICECVRCQTSTNVVPATALGRKRSGAVKSQQLPRPSSKFDRLAREAAIFTNYNATSQGRDFVARTRRPASVLAQEALRSVLPRPARDAVTPIYNEKALFLRHSVDDTNTSSPRRTVRKTSAVAVDTYVDPMTAAAARRRQIDESTGFVPHVVVRSSLSVSRRAHASPYNPRANAIPRLGSPPYRPSLSCDNSEVQEEDSDEQPEPLPALSAPSLRVRLHTRPGDSLGRSPAKLAGRPTVSQEDVQGSACVSHFTVPPDFTLPDGTLVSQQHTSFGTQLSSLQQGDITLGQPGMSSVSSYATVARSGLPVAPSSLAAAAGFGAPTNSDFLEAALPELDYLSPSDTNTTTSASALASPVMKDLDDVYASLPPPPINHTLFQYGRSDVAVDDKTHTENFDPTFSVSLMPDSMLTNFGQSLNKPLDHGEGENSASNYITYPPSYTADIINILDGSPFDAIESSGQSAEDHCSLSDWILNLDCM